MRGSFIKVRLCRHVPVVAAVCTLAATTVAQAVVIPAGIDQWETLSASMDFGVTAPAAIDPVPADFFGPGSDPFVGVIGLAGVPIDPIHSTADTFIERLADIDLPTIGSFDTVPIELVALSLVSIAPIIVTHNGGQNPESWDVSVSVAPSPTPAPASTGTLTATKTHANGGVFDLQIPDLYLQMTFVKVGEPLNIQVLVWPSLIPVDLENPNPLDWTETPPPNAPLGADWGAGTPNVGVPWTPVTINGFSQTVIPAELPEPGMFSLVVLGGLVITWRRRQKPQ